MSSLRLSTTKNPHQIPHFTLLGQPGPPEVLSNKVVLTPVSPGNVRGAVWSNTPLTHSAWEADVDFRVNGPERGGGIMNIWLAREGQGQVGSHSIYTVGKFDGLALVIDQHAGSGGMVRGFLNDGSVGYNTHHSVDSLAFGHCTYSYRNLGRPTQIKMRQTAEVFKVEIDGQACFQTDKFSIPVGYHFGITAATPDTPDSFEVFKLAVMSHTSTANGNSNTNNNQNSNDNSKEQQSNIQYQSRAQIPNPGDQGQSKNEGYSNFPDQEADVFQTSKLQFQDLHNRLQSSMHQLNGILRAVSNHHQMDEKRHDEVKAALSKFEPAFAKIDQINEMQRKIGDLEREVQGLRHDLSRKLQSNEQSVKGYLSDHHSTLSQKIVETTPGHGRLIFVFVGLQVFLVGSYVVYKRRTASMPKKYL